MLPMTTTYQGKIKLFSDGANLSEMVALSKDPLIKGLTTNPSLIKKAGVKNYQEFCADVLQNITHLPISFEVFADEFAEMERQAKLIASWGDNVYVKIPITNSKRESSIPLIQRLASEGIKLNVTAILTLPQVTETVNALKSGPASIVSVFAGRIADTGRNPMPLLAQASEVCKSAGDHVELLWASTRELLNIIQAESVGCDIITCTTDLLKKLSMINKDLDELSLETVQMFKNDAESAGFQL